MMVVKVRRWLQADDKVQLQVCVNGEAWVQFVTRTLQAPPTACTGMLISVI